jgi:hypothetical protein
LGRARSDLTDHHAGAGAAAGNLDSSRQVGPANLIAQTEKGKMHFVVDKDTEAGDRAGGTFRVACLSIEDPDRNSAEITKLVDQEKHFLSNDELKEYISGRFNIPLPNIDLIAE